MVLNKMKLPSTVLSNILTYTACAGFRAYGKVPSTDLDGKNTPLAVSKEWNSAGRKAPIVFHMTAGVKFPVRFPLATSIISSCRFGDYWIATVYKRVYEEYKWPNH